MIYENTFKKVEFNGAKGLIFLGNQIVVCRRDMNTKKFPGCLDMIGGGREDGESPFDTFKREVREEVGLDIGADDIDFSCPFQSFDDPTKILFFFVTKPLQFTKADIRFGDEGTEWLLMTVEEYLNSVDAIPRQRERVRRFLEGKLG